MPHFAMLQNMDFFTNPYLAKDELTRFRYHVSHFQRRVYSFLKYVYTLTLKTRAYVHVLT